MAISKPLTTGAALLIGSLFANCSLTRPDVDECQSNETCAALFGPGYTCDSDQLCQPAPTNARCQQTFPQDLLTRPERHTNKIVVGSLADRSATTQIAREQAIELAIRQLNEQNGIAKRQLGVVFCNVAPDSQIDPLSRTDAAVASAKFLIDKIGVPAIIGPSASDDMLATFEAVKDRGSLLISAGRDKSRAHRTRHAEPQ